MAGHDDPVENLAQLLRTYLGDALAPAECFSDMFTSSGVLEFPYAPADFPTRLEGREGHSVPTPGWCVRCCP